MERTLGSHDVRVAELLEEYLQAAREGNAPGREEFLAEHPGESEALRAALRGVEFVEGAEGELARSGAAAEIGRAHV